MNTLVEPPPEEQISPSHRAERETVERLSAGRDQIIAELAKVIVGQHEVIEQILITLLAGGHCLITGAPGLAKTLLVKSIARIFHLKFQRIQFTPDLMPADITGTEILQDTGDDRKMDYLPEDEEVAVVTRTTSEMPAPIAALFTGEDVLRFHEIVRKVPVAEEIVRYAVKLAAASRPHQPASPDFINQWGSWGAGTRAGQFLVLGAKARALLKGRAHVTMDDIRTLAYPTLRHRILLNYRAEAEGVTVESVIKRLIETVSGNVVLAKARA